VSKFLKYYSFFFLTKKCKNLTEFAKISIPEYLIFFKIKNMGIVEILIWFNGKSLQIDEIEKEEEDGYTKIDTF